MISLVGLVVFVLAVNGVTETWISYRATKTTLTDAMSEKADATAKRIDQSIFELERQISWVTRGQRQQTLEQRRSDYAQLLNQISAVSQLTLLNGQGHEMLRLSRTQIAVNSNADFSRDSRFTETVARGRQLLAGVLRRHPALHVDLGGAFRLQRRRHRRRHRPPLPLRLSRRHPGRQGTFAYVVDPRGQVLATSVARARGRQGPLRSCPRSQP